MVRIKSLEETIRRYAKRSLMVFLEVFLEGKKNLNWIKGIIRESGILKRKEELKAIFHQLNGYGDVSALIGKYW